MNGGLETRPPLAAPATYLEADRANSVGQILLNETEVPFCGTADDDGVFPVVGEREIPERPFGVVAPPPANAPGSHGVGKSQMREYVDEKFVGQMMHHRSRLESRGIHFPSILSSEMDGQTLAKVMKAGCQG